MILKDSQLKPFSNLKIWNYSAIEHMKESELINIQLYIFFKMFLLHLLNVYTTCFIK